MVKWSKESVQNLLIPATEYGFENRGGRWYYTQRKPGTTWVDNVSNSKGWTVDFRLRVNDIQDSLNTVIEDQIDGVGIYVNDGEREEIIKFLTQEIDFVNTNYSVIYDTTNFVDYRLTGKGNNLKLFAKNDSSSDYAKIADTTFGDASFVSGNSLSPNIYEDLSGVLHAVWWDDGINAGSIYYSYFSNNSWSTPEKIIDNEYGARNPSIIVDSNGLIYVVCEVIKAQGSIVALLCKNNIGWSEFYYTGTGSGKCSLPKLSFDHNSDVVVVWEDSRYVHSEIYIDTFFVNKRTWRGEKRVTISAFGSYNPCITSYMSDVYISWTEKDSDMSSSVKMKVYYANNDTLSSEVSLSEEGGKADGGYILASMNGSIFSVWHNDVSGEYKIYGCILNPSLTKTCENLIIVNGHGGAKYPVLSEHTTTGDIYIIWQDFSEDYTSYNPVLDEYTEAQEQNQIPINSQIYIAVYQNGSFLSSGQGSFDVQLTFNDERYGQYPASPLFFNGELPIVYECSLRDEYNFVQNRFFTQVRSAFYDLNRISNVFNVNYGNEDLSPSATFSDRDLLISSISSCKEIRFGDFSNLINSHYVFEYFKIYSDDAVEPYSIKEIGDSSFNLEDFSASDAVVNNYGDVWIVGVCGIYYYIDRQNRLIEVKSGGEIPVDTSVTSGFKCIAFDKNGYMYIGGNALLYSTYYVDGFKTASNITLPSTIRSMAFDNDNKMFIGTENGLKIYEVLEGISPNNIESGKYRRSIVLSFTDITNNYSNIPLGYITTIKVDANNCVWIGSQNNGIYRFYKNNIINITTSNGLSSTRINDIAVRNTAIRYVATPLGIDKMVGLNVEKRIQPDDGLWSGNVKSLLWKDPNVIYAGTLNKINQILVDDIDDSYSTSIYAPRSSDSSDINDLRSYFILSDRIINDSDLIEVYINGNRIHYGYTLGIDNSTSNRIIYFDTPLANDDIVEAVIRKDLKLEASFEISEDEKTTIGNTHINISDFSIKDGTNGETFLYVVTEGDENEIKVNDSSSNLPFDRIHLDTTPPSFKTIEGMETGIFIGEQINKSIVKVNIVGATDENKEGDTLVDAGSGLDRMIISNYENFTTDGTTKQSSVPFSTSVNHDLGLTLEDVLKQITFSSGSGSCISYFDDVNEVYAATSAPGGLYKYSWENSEWEVLISYDNDNYVDFVKKYNNQVLVGVGHNTSTAKIYVYNYSSNGLTLYKVLSPSESRAYCTIDLNGKLYIGTGAGSGEEGYHEGAGSGGAVYFYNDGLAEGREPYLDKIVEGLDGDVYDLTVVSGFSTLLASTGPTGYVYEINIENESASIIHSDTESLSSIASATYGDNKYVFTGGAVNGIIRRSLSNKNSFDISFRTIASSINALKVFSVSETGENNNQNQPLDYLYAAVGEVIYYLSHGGSWMWKYTHDEEIVDIAHNSNNNDLYVISSTGITKISSLVTEKSIYLKLIDRAGNETVLYETVGEISQIKPKFTDSVEISNLVDFVNDNKIMEIDEFGNILYEQDDKNNRFYSANKIYQEKGIYTSEIFNGTNDLVKWDLLTWSATELSNTEVLMYIRTSTSSNDILEASWIGPYTTSQSSGVDLSSFSGQYAQFKVELTSEIKSVSPTFKNATIRAVTTEAIHFFTTNFALPARVVKGILTSQKIVPIAADVVFGINTTNSVEWEDYQEVDENRLFNINQIGENIRIGIKLISPSRSSYAASYADEYGPYGSSAYINTIDFDFTNNTITTNNYHFRISLYSDYALTQLVYSAYSADSEEGFNVEGESIPEDGVEIMAGSSINVIFSVPGSANISCGEYYFVKIEYIYDESFEVLSSTNSFIATCSSSFVDVIDFNFTNNEASANNYHFRIRFYEDLERLNIYKTVFSGNDRDGWLVDDSQIPEEGKEVLSGETINVVYRPSQLDFESGKIYYLIIDVHDGSDYVYSYTSYTFQVNDVANEDYCGPYIDVPIVKNFGILFELDNNEFVTLNI